VNADDLKGVARAKLNDAQHLYRGRRYDSAFYLCGYALEAALKYRICRTHGWSEYYYKDPYRSFATHDLPVLLRLSGAELKIKDRFRAAWSEVTNWTVERRYDPVGTTTETGAREIIAAARVLLNVLIP
jgi:HEPN domain-containing protein